MTALGDAFHTLVRDALAPRRRVLTASRAALARERAALTALRADVERRQRRLADLAASLKALNEPFHGDMTIEHAWRHHPGAPAVFARYHLPACDHCSVRFDETVEEAALAYGLDLATLLAELNGLSPRYAPRPHP